MMRTTGSGNPVLRLAICCLLMLAVLAVPEARAQVTPLGGHHPTSGTGAGLEGGVSPTGGYDVSLPLELPEPRGDVPVPFQVSYTGSPRAGAAGAGFDAPLSFVHRSRDVRGRKPAIDGGPPPERLFLVLGSQMLMVPSDEPATFVPFAAASNYVLRQQVDGSWEARDAAGRRYLYTAASPYHQDTWLLEQVQSADGKDRVVLGYDVEQVPLCGNLPEIRLSSLQYSFDAQQSPLFQVVIYYRPWATGSCLGYDETGLLPRAHAKVIDRVSVLAHNNHDPSSAATPLRTHWFDYDPEGDRDTRLPRLTGIRLEGEDGAGNLPIAGYRYGAASVPAETGGRGLYHGGSTVIPRNFFSPTEQAEYGDTFSSSRTTRIYDTPLLPSVEVTATSSAHLVRDLTGDGLPDLVFRQGDDQFFYVANVTTPTGTRLDGTPLPLDSLDIHIDEIGYQTTFTPIQGEGNLDKMQVHETWVEMVDWNADGRMDILDAQAGMDENHWRLLVNMPHPTLGPAAVSWREEQIFIGPIRSLLAAHGHEDEAYGFIFSNRIPLSRSRTWTEATVDQCLRAERIGDYGDIALRECFVPAPGAVEVATHTITEWKLMDANGDSYPDLVANDKPAIRRLVREESTCGMADDICDRPQDFLDEVDSNALVGLFNGSYYECSCSRYEEPALATLEELIALRGNQPTFVPGLHLNVSYNHGGALFLDWAPYGDSEPFNGGATQLATDVGTCGLEWWSEVKNHEPTGGDYEGNTAQRCGFLDRNGDGLPSYVNLGTQIYYGAGLQRYESNRHLVCTPNAPDNAEFETRQTLGYVDVTGDGILDMVGLTYGGWWMVSPGTGGGFASVMPVYAPSFELSRSTGTCGGRAWSTAGAVDINGDGVPETARIQDLELVVEQLTAASGRAAVGRLVGIENRWGAVTQLTWGSAKEDTTTLHQVPFPEIVVAATSVEVESGPGGPIAPTRFAYGGAALYYNPLLARFAFGGYRRTVAVQGTAAAGGYGAIQGVASIADKKPAAPGHTGIATTGLAYATWRLEGTFGPDPRDLLAIDAAADPRLRAGATLIHDVALLPVANTDPSPLGAECYEADPLTNSFPAGDFALCKRSGIVYTRRTEGWEGEAPPPSLANVATATEVTEVDALGRITQVYQQNDLRSVDDDVCTVIDYAAPANPADRFLALPHSYRVTGCGAGEAGAGTIAGTRLEYDDRPETPDEGTFEAGRVTAVISERYNPVTSELLGEHVDARYRYEPTWGRVSRVTRERAVPTPATQSTDIAYDAWGLTPTEIIENGGPEGLVSYPRTNVLPSVPNSAVGPNGEETIVCRDALGRPVREGVRAGDVDYALRQVAYDDSASSAESTGRRVIVRELTGGAPLPVSSLCLDSSTPILAAHPATVAEVYLDALGRPMFTQVGLGADYANTTLVANWVQRDELGRVTFHARPFDHAESPFDPQSLATQPFGTSYFFDVGGRPIGAVDAAGPLSDLPDFTSEGDQIYVSRQEVAYDAGVRIVRRQGPAERQPESASFGARTEGSYSAIGWLHSQARFHDGARIELSEHGYDRLGQRIRTIRYGNPGSASDAVVWDSVVDSLGQELELREPGNTPLLRSFDEWGAVYETRWQDGAEERSILLDRDPLGRVTRERRMTGETLDSDVTYAYDVPVAPGFDAQNLLGRLSHVHAAGVMDTSFSYDALGRVAAVSRIATGNQQPFIARTDVDAGGRLRRLSFEAPEISEHADYFYDSAGRMRRVDHVAGTVTQTLFDADDVDALGRYREIALGNGVYERYVHEASGRGRLLSQTVDAIDQRWLREIQEYDGAGRVLGSRETTFDLGGQSYPVERERLYGYDAVGRLSSARLNDPLALSTLELETFTYDGLGNLRSRTDEIAASSTWFVPHAIDRDRLCAVAATDLQPNLPCPYTYDGAGNVTSSLHEDDYRSFVYDAGSRVTAMFRNDGAAASFGYDGLGVRASLLLQQGASVVRQEHHYGEFLSEVYTPADGETRVTRRIPRPAGLVAELRGTGATSEVIYNHDDGTANRMFTGSAGTIVQRLDYGPFGEPRSDSGNPGTIDYSNAQWNSGNRLGPLDVTILGARTYDPLTGRFLSRDPLLQTHGASASHPYAFAFSDPINITDPTGLCPWLFCADDLVETIEELGSLTPQEAMDLALSSLDVAEQAVNPEREVNGATLGTMFGGPGLGMWASRHGIGPVAIPGSADPFVVHGMGMLRGGLEAVAGALEMSNATSFEEYASGMNRMGWGQIRGQADLAGLTLTVLPVANAFRMIGPETAALARIQAMENAVAHLKDRVAAVHGVLDAVAQRHRTTAGLLTSSGEFIFAGGKADLTKAQLAVLRAGEVAARNPKLHAEITALIHAWSRGQMPEVLVVAPWRICPSCGWTISQSGSSVRDDFVVVWFGLGLVY